MREMREIGGDITEDSKDFAAGRDVAAPPPSSQPGVAGAPAPPAPSVNDGATLPSPAAPPQQKKKKGHPPKKAPGRGPPSAPGLSTPTTASC